MKNRQFRLVTQPRVSEGKLKRYWRVEFQKKFLFFTYWSPDVYWLENKEHGDARMNRLKTEKIGDGDKTVLYTTGPEIINIDGSLSVIELENKIRELQIEKDNKIKNNEKER